MSLMAFRMDAGEYLRIEAVDALAESDPPWDDLSGATVVMHLRSWSGDPLPSTPGTLDAADAAGKIRGCGAELPKTLAAGRYDGELVIDKGGAPGWPQVFPFALTIRRRLLPDE